VWVRGALNITIEGAAGHGAKGNICFKHFSATRNISYSAHHALHGKKRKGKEGGETVVRQTAAFYGGQCRVRTTVPSLFPTSVEVLRKKRGRSLVEKTTSMSPGFAAGSAGDSKRA